MDSKPFILHMSDGDPGILFESDDDQECGQLQLACINKDTAKPRRFVGLTTLTQRQCVCGQKKCLQQFQGMECDIDQKRTEFRQLSSADKVLLQ